MPPLINKVAIVTGASRGIGREIAEKLSQDGASVIINYRSSVEEAEKVVEDIKAQGGQASAIQADMSKIDEIRYLFQKTLDCFGHLDILVNNAGIFVKPTPIAETTEEEFDKVFSVNVRGAFFAIQEAARQMSSEGRIVNISSSVTVYTQADIAIYTASKGAVKQFTQVAAKELGERGITVNSVMPGPTDTDGLSVGGNEFKKIAADSSPFHRLGNPSDIANVVSFLASEKARWLTGQHILVNGGANY